MPPSIVGLVIAALGGAAVGFERQHAGHATGPRARFGGIRTFTLLGALGGMAGGFLTTGWAALAVVILAAPVALVVVSYAAASRDDIDGTTEVAAIVVLAAGTLAGAGQVVVASAVIAVTTLLLVEKTRLHALVEAVDDEALRASARFATLALVVLPLLPGGSYGPFGAIRPREIWALVLFFSGLSFAAWIGRRLLGAAQGAVVAGLLGGVISSTSVTLSFARTSRTAENGLPLALGTIGACTVMFVRVLVACTVLDPQLARAFVPYALVGLAVGVAVLAVAIGRRHRLHGGDPMPAGSPLQLGAALQMAGLFQIVLLTVSAVIAWWSVQALLLTSAMIGLTDLDALTLSLARNGGRLTPAVAAEGLAVGVLSNTLLKMTVAVVVGKGPYRVVVGAVLGVMAAAVGLTLLFVPSSFPIP
jgi:uncharacterized membrane protein (DUF4010 family)